jgi:cytochrome oxidase assembly protein ShyY1
MVVRGWVPTGAPAPSPPSGPVSIVGRVSASEAPGGDRPVGRPLPPGSVASVSPIALLGLVPYRLYDAYLVLTASVPAPPAVPALVPSPQPDVASAPGFYLQHIAYVVLWWVFGGFVLFLWWRMARDELAGERASAAAQGHG